ncbi:MAG: alpha/beta hydrolase [Xanthobacteraceae bacterium]
MRASRRTLIKALSAGVAALPTMGTETLAQGGGAGPQSTTPSTGDCGRFSPETEAFLARFAEAWRPLDPQQCAVLRTIYARLQGLPPPALIPIPELRRINTSLSFFLNAGAPPLPHIEERTIAVPSGRQRVRLYDPGTAAPAPTVILIHGGGWVLGDIDTYDGFARQIAKRSGLRCLSIEYALAPEHPFPAPLDDCVAAVRWAATEGADLGIDPARIALIGDSAGGNLALAVCLALRDAGANPVRGAALIYGADSLDMDTPSQRANGSGVYLLGTAEMVRHWKEYRPTRRRARIRSRFRCLPI